MSKNMGIYKILNLENGKFYLGSSNNLKKRKREHFWALKEGKHDNPYLQNAFNKYGEEKFVFEVIEYVYKEENLRLIEQNYLDKYDACNRDIGYNINKYASGGGLIGEDNPNYGKPMSEEQKQKIRETMIGRKYSLERRRNMSKGRKGKCIGKNHPMYGKPVSEARRKHQSKIMKGRYAGENNPFYGQKHSEETRNKMSKAKRGKTGELCPNSIEIVQLTKEGDFIKKHSAMQEAQRNTGVWASNIQKCCKGELKTSGGYKWMYYDDYIKLNKVQQSSIS